MAESKEPVEINDVGKIIQKISPHYSKRAALQEKKIITTVPIKKFELSYNSSAETLEPVYFWILDFLGGPDKVDKLVDTFTSSVGSGHFSDMGQRATKMQEEGMKIMQTIGILIKSVIQIIYDLRQFKIRLNEYKASHSENKEESNRGSMALKQMWLDNVDIKRGNSSIKAMTFSQQGSFATLLNSFFAVNSATDVNKDLDLNDIVKRVLEQRLMEFEEWKKLSEKELYKRYNLEKAYLRSQVDSMKLYARWATPYLKAAEELRMSSNLSKSAAVIKAFNTILLQLTIMKKEELNVLNEVLGKFLPPGFEDIKGLRKYYACTLVDFRFRGIPQRVDQHYAFGGKADVTISAYVLTEEEIELMKNEMDKSDIKEALKLVENATTTSLAEIEEDIRSFLDEKDEDVGEEAEEKKVSSEDVNPFTALLGVNEIKDLFSFKKEEKKEKKLTLKEEKEAEEKKIKALTKKVNKSESYAEGEIRKLAEKNARSSAFTLYDIYKKAHQMASVPLDTSW